MHWYTDGDAVMEVTADESFQRRLAMIAAHGGFQYRRRQAQA